MGGSTSLMDALSPTDESIVTSELSLPDYPAACHLSTQHALADSRHESRLSALCRFSNYPEPVTHFRSPMALVPACFVGQLATSSLISSLCKVHTVAATAMPA
eukprot:1078851-Pelagomonas_calceolata.AAC.1